MLAVTLLTTDLFDDSYHDGYNTDSVMKGVKLVSEPLTF